MAKQRRTATRTTISGALRSYMSFQKRVDSDDGFGNTVPGGEFVTQFSVYANLRPLLRGSSAGVEAVFNDKIQGRQPFFLTIRHSNQLNDVTIAWRVVDARNPQHFYNIVSPPTDPDNKGMWNEMIIIEGRDS